MMKNRSSAFHMSLKSLFILYIILGMITINGTENSTDNSLISIIFIVVQIIFTFGSEPFYLYNVESFNEDVKNKKLQISKNTIHKESLYIKLWSVAFGLALCLVYFLYTMIENKNFTNYAYQLLRDLPFIIFFVIIISIFIYIFLPNFKLRTLNRKIKFKTLNKKRRKIKFKTLNKKRRKIQFKLVSIQNISKGYTKVKKFIVKWRLKLLTFKTNKSLNQYKKYKSRAYNS
ncbi:hypothetical protein ACP3TN_09910 [Staphylococcus sp. IPLA37011]|uniref:hypothetical protein n=1 Tax=Staphylococcus TaxID=1279 RepID=UPI002554CBF6|nr:hypothetical protein [Staphylococcus equorum]MDK9872933.1 hypothetical protein [Staphylococcus equorum]